MKKLKTMDIKENIASRMIEAGGQLSVRSALNPMLWLCGIMEAPCFILCYFLKEIPTWLVIFIFLPLVVTLIGFLFLLLFDRDKLQSEEYQLKKRSMELVQQKGDPNPQISSNENIEGSDMIEDVTYESIETLETKNESR